MESFMNMTLGVYSRFASQRYRANAGSFAMSSGDCVTSTNFLPSNGRTAGARRQQHWHEEKV